MKKRINKTLIVGDRVMFSNAFLERFPEAKAIRGTVTETEPADRATGHQLVKFQVDDTGTVMQTMNFNLTALRLAPLPKRLKEVTE